MYRQGDIFFKRVETVDPRAEVVTEGAKHLLVAEGEATGHHHTLYAGEGVTITERAIPQDEANTRFIEIMSANGLGAELTHQEHATIQFPPGIYEVKRQREYEPEQNRYVAD